LLVVEISSTTLRFDRHVKVPMYARHGIPEVWVLDVNTGQLHYYRSPENGSYLTSDTVPLGRISIEALATTVDLSALAARRGSGSNAD
jgi:Uma2 family endonuclease